MTAASVPEEKLERIQKCRIVLEEALRDPCFRERLEAFARQRAAWLRRFRNVDDDYAAELVDDVIADTWAGLLTCDTALVDIEYHLSCAIRSRSRHNARRAIRFPHEPVKAKDHPSRFDEEDKDELEQRANDTFAATCRLSITDADVLLLVGLYEQGVTSRADVLAVTALTPLQYDAARHRLLRLCGDLPSKFRSRGRPINQDTPTPNAKRPRTRSRRH